MRDGAVITIRPIVPDDREELRDAFERLSPESRYRRFFGPMAELSDRELDYLTQVDHHDHEALVAQDPDGTGIAVARYVRTAAAVAEPAVVVADDWQGRGVGLAVLQALVRRACEEGIERFEAPVLATNTEAIRVLERLGQTTVRRAGREVQLIIALPAGDTGPGQWRALLAQFAAGALEPARTVIERMWPRRPGAPTDARHNVIVVGTDGFPDSGSALAQAAELAALSGARLEIVGAYRFMSGDHAEVVGAAVREAASSLRARGLTVGEHLRRGDPALALADVATEVGARLIVVGAGERSRPVRRILGSVADLVAERSPCNVLIVRDRDHEADRGGAV